MASMDSLSPDMKIFNHALPFWNQRLLCLKSGFLKTLSNNGVGILEEKTIIFHSILLKLGGD